MIRNIILGIVLSITLLIVIFSMTIPNNNFLNKVSNKYDIKEINYDNDLKMPSKFIVYSITIIAIVIVGELFIHTKKKHDLDFILTICFISMLIIYTLMYFLLKDNNTVKYHVLNDFIHYYLAIDIIIMEIVIFKKYLLKKIFK